MIIYNNQISHLMAVYLVPFVSRTGTGFGLSFTSFSNACSPGPHCAVKRMRNVRGTATRDAKLRARLSQCQKSQPRILVAALQDACVGDRAITQPLDCASGLARRLALRAHHH